MKAQKSNGDKCNPKVNTFLLSILFHISGLNKWPIVCWTSTLRVMIKSIKRIYSEFERNVSSHRLSYCGLQILVVALCSFMEAFTLQGIEEKIP